MKTINTRALHKCPICGARAILRKNASKEFQVTCTKCECRTNWYRKTDAVITWYNMMIQLWKNEGKLTLDTPRGLDTPKG